MVGNFLTETEREDGGMEVGWIDHTGKVVIAMDWDNANEFDSHGMAAVRKNGKWGWIDESGEVVLPLK